IEELELENQRIRNEMVQADQKKGFLGGLFGGNRRQQKMAEYQARQQQIIQELQALQKRRTQTMKLVQIQEYANVISLVLEVSIFPARYSWLAEEQKTESSKSEALKAQVWYG